MLWKFILCLFVDPVSCIAPHRSRVQRLARTQNEKRTDIRPRGCTAAAAGNDDLFADLLEKQVHANLRCINARQQRLIRHLEHRKLALQGAETETYECKGQKD